jgi:ribosomal protein S18 acetylase RimI-like enzyme
LLASAAAYYKSSVVHSLREGLAAPTEDDNAGGEFSLRPASPSDNDDLVALAAKCPMQADVSLLIERAPDFFALALARGQGWTLVARAPSGPERRPEIVGCVSVARRQVWTHGRPRDVAFVADLRVAPSHRGQGLAQALLDAVAAREAQDPAVAYVAATATGNAAVDGVVRRFGLGCPLSPVATMIGWQLLPMYRLRLPRGLEFGCAEERDRSEMVALLDEFGRGRALAPVFGQGTSEDFLARSPGMTLSDHLVARRRGSLVAVLGAWDAKQVKQTRVTGMPRALRTIVGVSRAAGLVLPLPRLPRVGERLAARYLRHFAHAPGEEAALAALLRVAVNEARTRRDHFALIAFGAEDPLQRCLAGIPRLRYHYQLVAGVLRSGEDPVDALGPGPFHDDAALA